jgi:microcystin-dependent protein
MDREIVYQGQIPLETDLLLTNKNTMVALGFLMRAVLGTSLSVDGLACTPNSPADMTVLIGPGSIHSLQNVDGTAYGTIPADTTNQIVKQGISLTAQSFNCPAPATTGHSIVYLIQAAYQDLDAGATVLPYYNASDPTQAWSGPNNSGVSQNTVRKGVCLLGVKAGTSATTGTQATPAPDAGYVGLYAVTVANGQTTITSPDIVRLATAPFIDAKLPAMLSTIQSGAVTFAQDTSGAANQINIALNPAPAALTNGMRVAVKVANSVTGATVMNTNGLGNVAVVTTSGAALTANAMVANGIYTLVYDANGNRWQLQGFTAASATGLLPANNLSDVSNPEQALINIGGRVPTGICWPLLVNTIPSGWLLCSGQTIGSASSGATARANADTQALFNALWADYTDAEIPIFTSGGAASIRGVDAATDWAANKRISLPDLRGRGLFGRDNMGGSAANRITNAGSGVTGTTLGATGGAENVTLTVNQIPGHTHEITGKTGGVGGTGAYSATPYFSNDGSAPSPSYQTNPPTGSTGGGQAHNNMPPGFICNWIIKL